MPTQPLPFIHRFLAIFFGFIFGLAATKVTNKQPSSPQLESYRQPATQDSEILKSLIPNGTWADDSQLQRFQREDVIRVLMDARDADSERALAISYLLAVLKVDYKENRNKLVEALSRCHALRSPNLNNCAFQNSSYLMGLARRGDPSLIEDLFAVHYLADGAFSEELGCFYSYESRAFPTQFIEALKHFSQEDQLAFCEAAAIEDGGGMADEDYSATVLRLQHVTLNSDSSLRNSAKQCLIGLRRGRAKAVQNR